MSDQTPQPGPVPREARRTTLLTGTVVVAFGLGVTGVGTLVMLGIASRSMPSAEYADFAVWWTVATLLGTSFGVFEVYLARLLIFELAGGGSPTRVTGVLLGRAMAMAAALGVVIAALSPLLADELFSGDLTPALLLWVFMCLGATQSLQRGAATGRHNMVAIATQLSTDGVARAAIIGVLAATGHDSVTTLALGACLSVVLSLLAGGRVIGPWLARPTLQGADVPLLPLVLLLIGTAGPLLANNGSVPWLKSTDAVSPHLLGAFAGALTLSRIPTQFFSAVMSPLLAHFSEAVEQSDEAAFERTRARAQLLTAGAGVAFIVAFALLGQLAIRIMLGPDFSLGVANLAVLAAASSGMFVGVVQQAALGALGRWDRIAWAWVVAAVAFVVVLLIPVDPLWRATAAPLVGVVAALLTMWLLGRDGWRSRTRVLARAPRP
ncbi:O-antigen/teichoic acid export membrane protein [Nocardioides sp. BE266]|uniref:lipopolysaccharide biosynthesis protein n=1 Tax=Nocardioides sp. BE266 TaxID=2817725 RepID=UPI00285FEECA|nr:lipopolysaccharide biosynthesis protein [Nocardioides sp. BE266]MDR7255333.1 O-antigen/teichoic acid export membrane protein [Nocardioides sp. BE266]